MPARSPSPKFSSARVRTLAAALANRILAAIDEQKLPERFIESYSKQFDRKELLVHRDRNRELQSIFEREILLACLSRVAFSLSERHEEGTRGAKGRAPAAPNPESLVSAMLDAIARARRWTAGDIVDIRGELNLYRVLIAKNAGTSPHAGSAGPAASQFRRSAGGGPFVDRCAFVLDPSMMENARVASAKFLREIEALADAALEESLSAK